MNSNGGDDTIQTSNGIIDMLTALKVTIKCTQYKQFIPFLYTNVESTLCQNDCYKSKSLILVSESTVA